MFWFFLLIYSRCDILASLALDVDIPGDTWCIICNYKQIANYTDVQKQGQKVVQCLKECPTTAHFWSILIVARTFKLESIHAMTMAFIITFVDGLWSQNKGCKH